MQSFDPGMFDYIKSLIDGQPNFSIEYNWEYNMSICNVAEPNYLQIFFTCSPVVLQPAAFMVRALKRDYLFENEIVPWKDLITNVGGHYNIQSYSFVCPVKGVYVFSASVLTNGDYIRVEILKNQEYLVGIRAENSDYDMSSSSGVIECDAGDVVWCRVGFGGYFRSHTHDDNVFSGYLLNRL